jgi:hypothetical protein
LKERHPPLEAAPEPTLDPPTLRARELAVANCDPAEENRMFELVCGIPRVATAALEKWRLA